MSNEQHAESGNTIRFHYVGRLDNGKVFDSSENRDPLEFQAGQNSVIPGVEEALLEMTPGESKSVRIPAEQAYGPRREDLVAEFNRDQMPAEIEPTVGLRLQLRTHEGHPFPAEIVEVTETTVKLDANHPLAGEALNFDLQLVEIVC